MVMVGREKIRRKATTIAIHTKTGIRISVMPGARIVRMVAMKLAEEAMDAIPSISRPNAQKSIRTALGDLCGEGRVPEPSLRQGFRPGRTSCRGRCRPRRTSSS